MCSLLDFIYGDTVWNYRFTIVIMSNVRTLDSRVSASGIWYSRIWGDAMQEEGWRYCQLTSYREILTYLLRQHKVRASCF